MPTFPPPMRAALLLFYFIRHDIPPRRRAVIPRRHSARHVLSRAADAFTRCSYAYVNLFADIKICHIIERPPSRHKIRCHAIPRLMPPYVFYVLVSLATRCPRLRHHFITMPMPILPPEFATYAMTRAQDFAAMRGRHDYHVMMRAKITSTLFVCHAIC